MADKIASPPARAVLPAKHASAQAGIGIRALRLRAQKRHARREKQIMLTIAPDLPATVGEMASRTGRSRAALISRTIHELAERAIS